MTECGIGVHLSQPQLTCIGEDLLCALHLRVLHQEVMVGIRVYINQGLHRLVPYDAVVTLVLHDRHEEGNEASLDRELPQCVGNLMQQEC